MRKILSILTVLCFFCIFWYSNTFAFDENEEIAKFLFSLKCHNEAASLFEEITEPNEYIKWEHYVEFINVLATTIPDNVLKKFHPGLPDEWSQFVLNYQLLLYRIIKGIKPDIRTELYLGRMSAYLMAITLWADWYNKNYKKIREIMDNLPPFQQMEINRIYERYQFSFDEQLKEKLKEQDKVQ
jgi:hypothetical protein